MNLLSDSEIKRRQFIEFTANVTGITTGYVLASRYAGIIRLKGQDPYEGELLLIASQWGTSAEAQDLTSLTQVRGDIRSIEDARKFEPGVFMYYLVILQYHVHSRRTGNTPIHTDYLVCGQAYGTLDEAVQAFDNSEKRC